MPADRLHLVRHGEVHNPRRVLYGRLPGYGLSADGRRMARQAAEYVQGLDRPITALVVSPLQRTRESAEPFTEIFGLEPVIDERVIEPTNVFEGRRMVRALAQPAGTGGTCAGPALPSWGEPYDDVIARMNEAMTEAWETADGGRCRHRVAPAADLGDPSRGRRASPPATIRATVGARSRA